MLCVRLDGGIRRVLYGRVICLVVAAVRRIRCRFQNLRQKRCHLGIWWQALHRPFALRQVVARRVVLEQIFAARDGSDHVRDELAVDADRADHERGKPRGELRPPPGAKSNLDLFAPDTNYV